MTGPQEPGPLAFATVNELLEELISRTDSHAIGLVLKGSDSTITTMGGVAKVQVIHIVSVLHAKMVHGILLDSEPTDGMDPRDRGAQG